MQIIHGTWIPEFTEDYLQKGAFYLWVETDQVYAKYFTLPTTANQPLKSYALMQFSDDESPNY